MIGELSKEMIDVMLETIPFEFSVIDADDKVLAWNRHDTRLFKRPKGVLGKDVRNCHPKKSLHMVEKIVQEMKDGDRDKARFWIDLRLGDDEKKNKILIEYYALRNSDGKYLGCMEVSKDITEIQEIKGEKRLLEE
jgi:DUF438 domain-containing protein